MRTARFQRPAALLLAAGVAISAAACGSSSKKDTGAASPAASSVKLDPKTKVAISIDCAPAANKPAEHRQWQEDVAEFNKTYPNVTINAKEVDKCEEPATFTAQLKGGTEPDVFYSYFTDTQQVLDSGQAADITQYVTPDTVPALKDIQPSVLNVLRDNGKLYGLPRTNYTLGLVINRKLFKQAGLDPDNPPTTWADIAADAKKIAALGNGINGYGDYSAANTGGWHFTAELYGLGGSAVTPDGKKAAFNDDLGKQVLQNLHQMRWVDKSMGAQQLLKWGDVQTQMAAGKLGMFVGAPDDVTYMVQTLHADYNDLGMGPMPGGKAALQGGDDYYFKKTDTPDQIKAGIAWINFKLLTMGKGQFNYARNKADGLPVGLPEPEFFTGASKSTDDQLKAASATMPVANFKPFDSNPVTGKSEPPNAQEIYKVLDNAMSAVLTDQNANIDQVLAKADSQVNQVLTNANQ